MLSNLILKLTHYNTKMLEKLVYLQNKNFKIYVILLKNLMHSLNKFEKYYIQIIQYFT